MGAIGMLAGVRFRRRWRSILAVGLLVAVAGGIVLTGLAGARRTRSALDRLGDRTHVANAVVLALFARPDARFTAKVRHLPGVLGESTYQIWAASLIDKPHETMTIQPRETMTVAVSVDDFARNADRSILVEGRRARDARELVLTRNVADRERIHIGQRVHIATFAADQLDGLRRGQDVAPHGPTIPLRVVGIDRRVADLVTQKGPLVRLGPPVWRRYERQVAGYATVLRVRVANGHEQAFIAAFHRLTGSHTATLDTAGLDTGGIDDSLGLLAVGLTLFSVLGALGAAATLLVMLTRWAASARPDQPIELALGQRPLDRGLAIALPMLPAAVAGSAGAVVIAIIGSAWMPIGAARGIEPDPGFSVDARVLGIGFLILLLLTTAATLITAWWGTRREAWAPTRQVRSDRATRVLAAVTHWRLPVPALIGSRMALDRGRGATAVPGRAAIVAAALGITGIVATLVVGAGMHQLRTEPTRWAYGFDTIVEGSGGLIHPPGDPSCAPVRTELAALPEVAAIANYCQASVTINGGRTVSASALGHIRGTVRPVILRGRAPRGPDEMALGEKSLARIDRSIGDAVAVRGQAGHARLRIVGTTFFPSPNSHAVTSFSDGALMTAPTLARLDAGTAPQLVIRWRPHTDLHRALARVRTISGAPGIGPVRPTEIDRLLQVDDLPTILAGFLALLALVGVTHAVVANASRRRRDLALLETLGFRTRQVVATIGSHAVTVAAIGLAIGIPGGVVAGRLAWRVVAHSVGVDDHPTIPVLLVLATIPAVLVAVLVTAAFPARRAAHIRPAVALRSE